MKFAYNAVFQRRCFSNWLICLAAALFYWTPISYCESPESLLGTFETPKEAIFAEQHTRLKTYEFMTVLFFELTLSSRTDLAQPRGRTITQHEGSPIIQNAYLFVPTTAVREKEQGEQPDANGWLSIKQYQAYTEGDKVLLGSPATIKRIAMKQPVRPSDVLIRTEKMPKGGVGPMGAGVKPAPVPSIHQFKQVRWAIYAEGGQAVYPLRSPKNMQQDDSRSTASETSGSVPRQE